MTVIGQSYLFDAQHVSIEDGLPDRMVTGITQDNDGFIWMSTMGNIHRYDGYSFKGYNYKELQISGTNFAELAVDKNNYLWYCEKHFFNKTNQSGIIDLKTDSIHTIEDFSNGLISSTDILYLSTFPNNPNKLIFTTVKGEIYTYDESFKKIYQFKNPRKGFDIFCKIAPDGSIWIFNYHSIIQIKNGKVALEHTFQLDEKFQVSDVSFPISDAQPVVHIQYVKRWEYLMLDKDKFIPFNTDISTFRRFVINRDLTCFIDGSTVFIKDKNDRIVYQYDNTAKGNQEPFYRFLHTKNQDIIWLTSGNGLVKISYKKNSFQHLEAGNSIRGIFKDDQIFALGGYKGNYFESKKYGSNTDFFEDDIVANAFFRDNKNNLWIGSPSKHLLKYNPKTNVFKEYTDSTFLNHLRLPFQNPKTGRVWIGTNNGLMYLKGEAVVLYELPIDSKNLEIRHFHHNKSGIWIATSKGIFLMNVQTEKIIHHYSEANGFPFENINHLHEDKNSIFWVATRKGGLIRWDIEKNSFRTFTRKDGLSNNNIYAVYGDDYENLWLSSDYGLMRFDKASHTTILFLPQNGIAHEEFNTFAHFQAKDGTLYFGGLNGIITFHPKNIRAKATANTPLYINKVKILRQKAENFKDETASFFENQSIRLRHNDKILEIELALLDYENTTDNHYAYKIIGHNDQWIYTDDNKISILSLPYGKYTLEIKARGTSGIWSENMVTIPLIVATPFYLKWWFFVLIIAVIAVCAYFYIKWREEKLRQETLRLENEVAKRTATISEQAEALKVLDKAKTRFFSNITHEFRTPLTLITGPLEQLLQKRISPSVKRTLFGIKKNARHLESLINQLLDLSKLESGNMKIEATRGDIVSYTNDLVQQLQPLAKQETITLKFISKKETWDINFDKKKWNKIVFNLVSNALKFTPKNGVIHVVLAQDKVTNQVNLYVQDTGIGIVPEKLLHIFDRFYQVDGSTTRMQEGTGIGLTLVKELVELQKGEIWVHSEVNKGTTVEIKLPLLANEAVVESYQETKQYIANPHEFEIEEAPKNRIISNNSSEKLELLIIEDNSEMRAYIRSCIDEKKYHIAEAENGLVGVKKAFEIIPDIIITDVMMPQKDGFQVTYDIRNNILTSHIPLILLTAKASLESRLEGLERGADAYLTKPFSPKELVLRTQKLIELRQLMQARYQLGNQDNSNQETNTTFKKEDEFIIGLKSYIIEHLQDSNFTGEELANQFNMTRVHLHRKIKALTSYSTNEFIKKIRLEAAYKLLQQGNCTVSEVAYQTGFDLPSSFSRSFKKEYGKSPSKIFQD